LTTSWPTLKRARDNFKNPDKREISSFSLTATTGAGKTVMAAAAIEALFWGNDAFDFDPDPGAVVLWFSDDPSLNKQTFKPPAAGLRKVHLLESRSHRSRPLLNRASILARCTSSTLRNLPRALS